MMYKVKIYILHYTIFPLTYCVQSTVLGQIGKKKIRLTSGPERVYSLFGQTSHVKKYHNMQRNC